MFDASAYLAALEPPVFVDRSGRRHVGRILGSDDWFRLTTRFALARAEQLQGPAFEAALKGFVDAIFPRPAWRFWERRVSQHVWDLPPAGRIEAVYDFIASQG